MGPEQHALFYRISIHNALGTPEEDIAGEITACDEVGREPLDARVERLVVV